MEAVPRGFFSKRYALHAGGREVAVLKLSPWRERAELHVGSETFQLHREGCFGGRFLLEDAFGVVAEAEKPSALRSRYVLRFGGAACALVRPAVWKRTFVVVRDGAPLGHIRPAGWVRPKGVIELPEAWPVAVRAFAFWLVLIRWNREAAAG